MEKIPDSEKFAVKEKFADRYKAILEERYDEFIIPSQYLPFKI